jgi:DNA-binding XRE family transcriptional regulator
MRTAQGLSREVLAAAAGVSARTIYAIEIEGNRPQRATQRVLALALDCDVADIFPTTSEIPMTSGDLAKLDDCGVDRVTG